MILTCNSCEKKFVVPDQAITAAGRLVQCSACGNKWKQFPVDNEEKNIVSNLKTNNKEISKIPKNPKITKITKITKPKKKIAKKTREINLYSPEYLAKKHGINLNESKTEYNKNTNKKTSFGFYNSVLILIFFTIFFSRSLYFFQDFIIEKFPITEFYLNYFFESVKNIFEIIKSLIINY
jgi:predicted Zn finger-like uncharacterized protein